MCYVVGRSEHSHQNTFMMLGGEHDYIMLVLIMFSEMRVSSLVSCLVEFFET